MIKVPLPNSIKELATLTGVQFFVVGGYPRNLLLFDKVMTDYDICGPLTIDELIPRLEDIAKVIPVNPRIGTVLICYKGDKYEYTTFRKDSYPVGGVHSPDYVEFVRSVEEDSLRRDFRVNALYVDVATEELIDPLGGLSDLQKKVLVTTNGRKTFNEDGLRLLRLIRFASELGFTVEKNTLQYAKELAYLLSDISAERIIVELKKVLLSDRKNGVELAPVEGIRLLLEVGLDKYISSELSTVLRGLTEEQLNGIVSVNDLDRVAYIFYFVSKEYGIDIIPQILGQRCLKCSNAFIKDVRSLVEYALFEGNEEEKRLFVQRMYRYAERGDELCRALGKDADFYSVYSDMLKRGIPFNPKELHYCGLVLKKMKVKPEVRSKLLMLLLAESAKRNKRLSEEEERKIVETHL